MTARAARRPRIVRCPGCDKPAQDGTPTTTLNVVERGYGRNSAGFTFTQVEAQKLWHTACLDDFNARQDHLRADVSLSQDISVCVAALGQGMTLDQVTTIMRDSDRAEDHIAAVLAAVEEGRKH